MRKSISLIEAALPLIAMLVCLVVGAFFMPIGTELLVSVMLVAAAVSGLIAIRHGHSWEDIQRSTGDKIAAVFPVILSL